MSTRAKSPFGPLILTLVAVLFLAACQPAPVAAPTTALAAPTVQAPAATPTTAPPAVTIPIVPQVTVNVAISPYVDQSEVYLGVQQGFYKDVGITVGPTQYGYGLVIPYDQTPSVLASGRVDVAKYAVASIVPALPQNPGLVNFSYSDLFVGFAIMCQPDEGFKSVKEFQASGMNVGDAIGAAAKQLVGKTLVFAPDPSPLILINPAFAHAGITLDQVKVVRVQDAQGLALMQSKRADCQLPGAPIRVTLQSLGFKEVVDAIDVGQAAKPDVSSPELTALSLNGYTTTAKYWQQNHDTILRFASVGWRINDYINADIPRAVS